MQRERALGRNIHHPCRCTYYWGEDHKSKPMSDKYPDKHPEKYPIYTDLISASQLQSLAPKPALLDCRAKLGDAQWGAGAYLSGHIPGALRADLDAHLAAPPDARGRHPLPDKSAWIKRIREWGIGNDQQVVVYDDAGGAYAARAWWMFRWVGHAAVAVLDGGLKQWRHDLATTTHQPERSTFTERQSLTQTISTAEILEGLNSPQASVLIDARAPARFAGIEEPIDPVAGHIPGAVCSPFSDNLQDNGCFKSPTELTAKFSAFLDRRMVCYCGSGVTAAHNILALHICGVSDVALYPESWSGWITDPTRPVETGT